MLLVTLSFNEIAKNYAGTLTFNCDTLFCSFAIGLILKTKGNYCVVANGGWIDVNTEGEFDCYGASGTENIFTTKSFNREILEKLNIDFSVELSSTYNSSKLYLVDNNGAYTFKVE